MYANIIILWMWRESLAIKKKIEKRGSSKSLTKFLALYLWIELRSVCLCGTARSVLGQL